MFEKPALPTDFCCLGNNLFGDTAVVLLYATCDGAGLGGIFKNNQVGRFSIYLRNGHQGAPNVIESSVKSNLIERLLCQPGKGNQCLCWI